MILQTRRILMYCMPYAKFNSHPFLIIALCAMIYSNPYNPDGDKQQTSVLYFLYITRAKLLIKFKNNQQQLINKHALKGQRNVPSSSTCSTVQCLRHFRSIIEANSSKHSSSERSLCGKQTSRMPPTCPSFSPSFQWSVL